MITSHIEWRSRIGLMTGLSKVLFGPIRDSSVRVELAPRHSSATNSPATALAFTMPSDPIDTRDRTSHSHARHREHQRHHERRYRHRSRSRSPRDDRHRHGHRRSRSRSRSPRRPATLPFQAPMLDRHDFSKYERLFATYLDMQKQLDIADLDEREVKGRWKSFVGKWYVLIPSEAFRI